MLKGCATLLQVAICSFLIGFIYLVLLRFLIKICVWQLECKRLYGCLGMAWIVCCTGLGMASDTGAIVKLVLIWASCG